MHTIAYIASILPARSETFVYREIRELRRRGWNVVCVSLRQPTEILSDLSDLHDDGVIAYRNWRWHWDLGAEFFRRTGAYMRADQRAWTDVFSPGERMSLSARLKLVWQNYVSVALARQLRLRHVQHIHCHFAHAPTTIGMYCAAYLGIPFSFTGHANDIFQRRALLRRKLQRAAFINCISEWHKEFYISIEPSCAKKCHVVRCGVDVDSWAAPAQEPCAWNRTFHLLTVCRLVEKKGVDNLLRGLGKFHHDGGQFELTVAGDGPQRAALEAIAREEHIFKHVKFLGAVDNDRVRTLLQESDAFALTCRDDSSGDRDGIPVVLMEAMACGLPVISGDLPAIRELVRRGENGLLVDGNSIDSIADAIKSIAADSKRAAQLGTAGRARVVEEFSLRGNVDRIEKLLQATISTRA